MQAVRTEKNFHPYRKIMPSLRTLQAVRRPALFLAACLLAGCGGEDHSPAAQKGSQAVIPDVQSVDQQPTLPGFENPDVAGALLDEMASELGSSMQAAFDEQMRTQALGGTPEQIVAQRDLYDQAQVLAQVDAEAGWMAPETLAGGTYTEVLEGLLEGSQLALDPGHWAEHADQTCPTKITGLTRAQALEQVAQSLDLVPVYPDSNPWDHSTPILTFEKGPRRLPVAFSGPFVIEITKLTEGVPYGSGQIRVAARGLGLPAAMQCANHSMDEWFRIDAVRDKDGNNLAANPDMRMLSQPQYVGGILQVETEMDLTGLLQSVEEIAELSGSVHLQFPIQVNSAEFIQMQPTKKVVGGLEVQLSKAGVENRLTVDLGESLNEKVEVMWAPSNFEGEPLGLVHQSSFGFQNSLDASMTTSEKPHVLGIKLLQTESARMEFTLPAIPLAQSQEQPSAVKALKFEPAQPVSVVFVEFVKRDSDFPEVSLRSVNHCNKDVQSAQVELSYLNDKNKTIKEMFTTINAPFDGGATGPLVRSGESVITTEMAFFMPKEAVSVQVRVIQVEFMDRTRWEGK